jgi:hypothetical protein
MGGASVYEINGMPKNKIKCPATDRHKAARIILREFT